MLVAQTILDALQIDPTEGLNHRIFPYTIQQYGK